MDRRFSVLLIFSVITYSGKFSDIVSSFAKIDHNVRKLYCCGAKALRRRSNRYNELYPVLHMDYNEKNEFFITACDHTPCLGSNTEFEFTVGHLVLINKLTKLDLNSIRPISIHDITSENQISAPQYGTPSFGCWYVK